MIVQHKMDVKQKPAENRFTGRELEILQLISVGMTSYEIGKSLHITLTTVESHRKNMMRKAGTSNMFALLRYAFTHGILK